MNKQDKIEACVNFFNELASELSSSYEVLASCNNDISTYLIPNGTSDEVSYTGKPDKSFRISDHWNWFANVNKCPNEHYVQCLSVDLPWAKKRVSEGKPSKPVFGIQVSVIGDDGKYHCVFGEKFDRKTKTWSWVDAVPSEVAASFM